MLRDHNKWSESKLVSESVSFKSGVSRRYASAIFSVSIEDGSLKELEQDLEKLAGIIEKSEAFRTLLRSPLNSRYDQFNAVRSISKKVKLSKSTTNLLLIMAQKRRLAIMPDLIIDVKSLLNEHRGETTVEVVSAVPFSTAQQTKLAKAVEASIGKKIKLGIEIDKTVIGGLIVKVGSRMIDTTVKTKLLKLQNIMKEVN